MCLTIIPENLQTIGKVFNYLQPLHLLVAFVPHSLVTCTSNSHLQLPVFLLCNTSQYCSLSLLDGSPWVDSRFNADTRSHWFGPPPSNSISYGAFGIMLSTSQAHSIFIAWMECSQYNEVLNRAINLTPTRAHFHGPIARLVSFFTSQAHYVFNFLRRGLFKFTGTIAWIEILLIWRSLE